jgi:GNAT superfamily N-acetyltransferase
VPLGVHAVFLHGFDKVSNAFQFGNSWGRHWGNSGHGTLPYSYFERGLFCEAWCCWTEMEWFLRTDEVRTEVFCATNGAPYRIVLSAVDSVIPDKPPGYIADVYEPSGLICGWLHVWRAEDGFCIEELYVLRQHRGLGVGSRLVKMLECDLTIPRGARVTCGVGWQDLIDGQGIALRCFFERQGYRVCQDSELFPGCELRAEKVFGLEEREMEADFGKHGARFAASGKEAIGPHSENVSQYVRSQTLTKLALFGFATILVVAASLLAVFAPEGRENVAIAFSSVLLVLAAGFAGFSFLKVKGLSLELEAGETSGVKTVPSTQAASPQYPTATLSRDAQIGPSH